MSKILQRLIVISLLFVLILSACTGSEASNNKITSDNAAAEAQTNNIDEEPANNSVTQEMQPRNTGSKVGDFAPGFTVPTLDGSQFNLVEQQGKPAVIFFMAYWCGTCIPEARALGQLQQEYGDDLTLIAIDVDPSSTLEALTNFKEAADNANITWAFDTGQQVTNDYQVQALDTTLILDSEGRIVYRDAFPTTYDVLKEALAELGL